MVSPLTEQELQAYRLERALEDLDFCKKAAQMFPFRAGDCVKHVGTGETWVLACDQQDNDVLPAGWPECVASATHCRLVKAATDAERLEMLRNVSESRSDSGAGGRRQRLAAVQLASARSEDPHVIWQAGGNPVHLAPRHNPEAGSVRLLAKDGSTTLLFAGNGDIFVRDEKVDNNHEVYAAFVEFIGNALGITLAPKTAKDEA